jgi:hypothetical protein
LTGLRESGRLRDGSVSAALRPPGHLHPVDEFTPPAASRATRWLSRTAMRAVRRRDVACSSSKRASREPARRRTLVVRSDWARRIGAVYLGDHSTLLSPGCERVLGRAAHARHGRAPVVPGGACRALAPRGGAEAASSPVRLLRSYRALTGDRRYDDHWRATRRSARVGPVPTDRHDA